MPYRPTIGSRRLISTSAPTAGLWGRSKKPFATPVCKSRKISLPLLVTHLRRTSTVPFRKQVKDSAREQRTAKDGDSGLHLPRSDSRLVNWELTVGIEIHAQLNTDHKLFSRASTLANDLPNTRAAYFDLALPGTQPVFQPGTVIPAVRAALALNCTVQRSSSFDRKHYFYQDQPAGYQITQYYAPLAKDGYILLDATDGIADEDGESVRVGIQQIQLEQDTAKTVQQPPDSALLDFNRVGHPLIEIITLPQIHSPQTAAACVRKIQSVLQAVSSVTTGMEMGGLRADVNVSVRPRGSNSCNHSYHGVTGLGQRTEIKNLSSFKAVEDAIIAERNRQITLLEDGGHIDGETRGWSLGSTETRRLRGKEGEVDYRYMPEPDLPPLRIGQDLVDHLKSSMPILPDQQIENLVNQHCLSPKDAKTLVPLNGGRRLDYYASVLRELGAIRLPSAFDKVAANWVLHELGGLLSTSGVEFDESVVRPKELASILKNLHEGRISGKSAKEILSLVFNGDQRRVKEIITENGLEVQQLSEKLYNSTAKSLIEQHPEMAAKVRAGESGKLQWFVGQMLRQSKGRMEAGKAINALKHSLGLMK